MRKTINKAEQQAGMIDFINDCSGNRYSKNRPFNCYAVRTYYAPKPPF